MKSAPDKVGAARRGVLAALVPRSIVARTSLAILLLAVVMGLLFSLMASWRVRSAEHDRLVARVNELTSTVESTVSIACFLNDATLAKEIATGLMKNRIVAGVRIMSGATPLFGAAPGSSASVSGTRVETLTRTIYSPFDRQSPVGEITLYVSHTEIETQAASYARYTIWILSLQVSIVAAAVAFLVYLLVTRPIKGISDELHRLEIRSGMQLTMNSGRREDEIGQLVGDVNALISRLTDALATERELRLAQEISERRMRLIFEKADTGMLVLDKCGVIQSFNPAFARIVGPAAAVPGALLGDLLAPHGTTVSALLEACQASNEARDVDLDIDLGTGRGPVWVELSVNPLGSNLLQALVNDITDRKRAEAAARELASRDTLTGLLNRRGFDWALTNLLASARDNTHFALLQIDLDHFKEVNDAYGHEAGDRVLCEVARVFERTVRRSDIVSRLGGDEFSILLPGIESAGRAMEIANCIIAGVSVPIDIGDGLRAQIGASVGIAFAESAHETPASFLRRADVAMYEAKQAGRGRACMARQPVDLDDESDAA